jgi:hypothetical protein
VRFATPIGLVIVLLVLTGCGLMAQGPPPETQICQGWWQWEEMTIDGSPLGNQGVEAQGLSLADCEKAKEETLSSWKELYRFTPHTAGDCECKDIPPTERPNMARLREAQGRLHNLHESVNAILYTYSDKLRDDFLYGIRSVADLNSFNAALERHEGLRYQSADYVLALQEIYEEIKYIDGNLKGMNGKPLRQVDTLVNRALASLGRLEGREATIERQFKEYYAVEKYWFGSDEDGVLSGPFKSEEAVRGGRPIRLRFVWYLYRPKENNPFLFFETKALCEAGRSFWQGVKCADAPTSDLEMDALRRGDRVDFKQMVYDKYRIQ